MAKVKFYFDEMMSRTVAQELIKSGYDVVMAVDVGMTQKDDDTEHLAFATQEGRVLVTLDEPFAGRTAKRTDHAGLICWTPTHQNIGSLIRALSDFADTYSDTEARNRVFWLR